uniref:Uncharacterized protein n=1 Tax=Panagrolaimus superbus TaxID=310955 RepID=A0A914YDU7_9BILA
MLHVIHNLTKVILKVLLEHEKKVTGNINVKQSSVEWLITEICRYFSSRAAAKYPSVGRWILWCIEKGYENYTICSLLGHRFNIIPIIAAQILMNKDRLIVFINKYAPDLEKDHGLATALANPLIVMHLQILAQIDSKISGPLWRAAENDESVLRTREYAQELLVYFNRVKQDPMIFFDSEEAPLLRFENTEPQTPQSIALKELLGDMVPVTGCSEIIPFLASGMHDYFAAQFKFELSDDFPDLSELEVAGAVSTNRACEAVFGYVDYLCKKSPNMSTETRSIMTVALKNQVFEWLSTLSKEKYEEIIRSATEMRVTLQQNSLEKAKKLKRELLEEMEKHAAAQLLSSQRNDTRLAKIQADIDKFGFWETETQMEASLSSLTPRLKIEAVKANLRYRKFVVQIGFVRDQLFRFSSDGNSFDLDTLKSNLSELMEI